MLYLYPSSILRRKMMRRMNTLELLRKLVAIPSVNPHCIKSHPELAGEKRIADFIEHLAHSRGIRTSRIESEPGRPTLLLELPAKNNAPDAPLLACFAHTDTVWVPNLPSPFEITQTGDGFYYGLGVTDDKASLAAALFSLFALQEQGGAPCRFTVVCTCDEEAGFAGIDSILPDRIRPDAAMGYAACAASEHNTFTDGNYGAGTGASVGKLIGADHAMKSGQGMYGVQCGKLQVCAVVAVNACGNVRDVDTRQYLAGVYREGKIMDPLQLMEEMAEIRQELPHGNTTIGCIITNAVLNKSQCNKISSIAHNGYADAIFPVHTMSDGDTIFTLATQEVAALPDTVGALAVYAMGKAINRAVLASQDAYGLKAASSIRRILDERQ